MSAKLSPELTSGWRFEPERRIGEGATSTVWLAADRDTGTRVALKIGRAGQHRLLADEAERLVFVDSPALARIVDAGRVPRGAAAEGGIDAGAGYIAMEWFDGRAPLAIRAVRGPGRAALALAVARDVGEALADLHAAGSSHGDVKPDNIIVLDRQPPAEPRARLVDLGLSSRATDPTPRGGTRRYLAPELFDPDAHAGDGRTRDLWALGITLAEIASPRVARADDPAAAASRVRFHRSLAPIVQALLSSAPGARPSATWVRDRARHALGEPAPEHSETVALRRRRVRREYLAVRRGEILSAARLRGPRVGVEGAPKEWTCAALELAKAIATLRGELGDDPAPSLDDLDELGRADWLVGLAGASAAAWPPLAVPSDSVLADRLLALAERCDPGGFTYGDLQLDARGAAEPHAAAMSLTEIALDLGAGTAKPDVLDAAERIVREGDDEGLALALGRALRLRGEAGRALAVLSLVPSAAGLVEAAETARRAGARSRAAELLERAAAATPDGPAAARAAATRARLALDSGDATGALELLEGAPATAATLETRALAQIALGDRTSASAAIETATTMVATEEERARLAGVEGSFRHAGGEPERALAAFRRAASHATRAGAVLEEATYLTGVAAAAADVGDLEEGLAAARRATLLFRHLGRPRDAARASLARVAAYSTAGAIAEATDAAEDALRRAREAGDRRSEGYVHLALADALDEGASSIEQAERARELLAGSGAEDELRAHARLLRYGAHVDVARWDAVARAASTATDARLDWWGARAEAAAAGRESARADLVVRELTSLAPARAAVSSRGPAFVAGTDLAARSGDGEAARRLALAGSSAARELIARCPGDLKPAVRRKTWVDRARSPREASVSSEQIADVEALVHALGSRDRLKPLLDQVLDALVLWTGVERGLLLLRAPGGRLVPRAARNLARKDITGEQRKLSYSLAERALAAGEPVVAVDATGELSEVHASVHALKLRSVLAVPLQARGESLGVVYLDDRQRRGAFGPRELDWVRLVAALASVAIVDARDQLLLRRAARRARRAERRAASALAEREAELDTVERELARARGARETRFAYEDIIGESRVMHEMLQVVDRVTVSDVPVLLRGESGSGKELVARAIHAYGPRKSHRFVAENCSAIPHGLLESTLFGHVRGAFTGAVRARMGLFETANHGTLFLDEIAEMTLEMQAKLLRVLENGVVSPVGAETPRTVDVRIIAATHHDLAARVTEGLFREDLLYRLNVITIAIPPLRERAEDIPLLVRSFLQKHAPDRKVTVSSDALAALTAFQWPGNVRQLENEIRRAIVLAEDDLDVTHLSREVLAGAAGGRATARGLNVRERIDALETELVREALQQTGGNQTRAAELLSVSRFGLQKMMKRLGIEAAPTRGGRGRGQGVADGR